MQIGDQVRIIDNRQELTRIGINYETLVGQLNNDFSTIFTIRQVNSISGNIRFIEDVTYYSFNENCLELVERARLAIGSYVKIIDDVELLLDISIERNELDNRLEGDWETSFIIVSGPNSGGWYQITGTTGYTYKRENLELVTDNMPEKKAVKTNKEPVKLPTLEEVEAMSAVDVYNKYYSKFKKIIDNDIYLTVKYEVKSGKSKVEFIAQLKKLFFGETSCYIQNEKQAKQIVVNYLKEGADLREKLEILKKITKLEDRCRKYLNINVIEEIKARTAILINREHNLLFADASKKNCEDYFEEAKKNVVGLEELKKLCANIEENFEKIEAQLVEIKKAEQRLEAVKGRLQISYKNDSKKLSLIGNRKQLLERLDLIKNPEKNAIVESIKSYTKDDLISIYAETKKFFKKHKIKI